MRSLALVVLSAAAAAAQNFTLTSNPEEAIGPLSPSTTEVVPTLASVEAETRALESRHDLTEAERERERQRLQRDYAIATQMLELEKAREARRAEAEKQGHEFTRLFLQLDMAADDFAARFYELEKKYPLAAEEPLSRKLIERARRFIARESGEEAPGGPQAPQENGPGS
ncbi:MAG: hypothetical protein N2322_01695 [Terrimicrobiaceae bacterium]|nr:hypothetical protein [Terrimicrobiaceae bacterium]